MAFLAQTARALTRDGHTHKAEVVELSPGKLYVNSGNWMRGSPYVEICHGKLSLERFELE